jgi:hypothetical protein
MARAVNWQRQTPAPLLTTRRRKMLCWEEGLTRKERSIAGLHGDAFPHIIGVILASAGAQVNELAGDFRARGRSGLSSRVSGP